MTPGPKNPSLNSAYVKSSSAHGLVAFPAATSILSYLAHANYTALTIAIQKKRVKGNQLVAEHQANQLSAQFTDA